MSIVLLCPTRGRPEQCRRMIESVCRTKSPDTFIDIYTARPYDSNDRYDIGNLCKEGSACHKKLVTVNQLQIPEWPTGYTWNYLAEMAMQNERNQLFMLAADDMIFSTPCWDTALLDVNNDQPHVYHLLDSRDPNGTPHPIVNRAYINAMGYFLPPIFLHWYVDSWTVDIAKANNCFTHLKDYMLIHDKPSDRNEADETHNRIRSMGWRERDGWVNEHCRHFLALEKSRLKMKMLYVDEEIIKGISVR